MNNSKFSCVSKFSALALAAAMLSACGAKDVSFDTLEQARSQARDNATYNAQAYRQNDPRVRDWSIISNGDSTQTPDCPQGDGWASVKIVSPDNKNTYPLKCSTVSVAVGCMPDTDFKGKIYANDDGHCQPVSKVPFPIKKLAN
jgi:hypothetical protein